MIVVEGARKRFKLYHDAVFGPVQELLCFWRRGDFYEELVALDDVSFSVAAGEVVGVIGANGAGKSTLLKLIAGLLPLDGGRVEVAGRVTALLALGVGVHPEFSGRETILHWGMLLGMAKREVRAKLEEIVDFAELGAFVDRPVRTYSSGMRARLLFATALSVEPEVLIVDEALAAGDAHFVQKSAGRLHALCRSGATVLFVSHDLRQVQSLCGRALLLERGRLVCDGAPDEVVRRYIASVQARGADAVRAQRAERFARAEGDGALELTDAYLRVAGARAETVTVGGEAELVFELTAAAALPDVQVYARLSSPKALVTYAILPHYLGRLTGAAPQAPVSLPAGESRVVLELGPLTLGDGPYAVDLYCFPAGEGGLPAERPLAVYPGALAFQAVYTEAAFFGRGSLTELPVRGLRVEAP